MSARPLQDAAEPHARCGVVRGGAVPAAGGGSLEHTWIAWIVLTGNTGEGGDEDLYQDSVIPDFVTLQELTVFVLLPIDDPLFGYVQLHGPPPIPLLTVPLVCGEGSTDNSSPWWASVPASALRLWAEAGTVSQ